MGSATSVGQDAALVVSRPEKVCLRDWGHLLDDLRPEGRHGIESPECVGSSECKIHDWPTRHYMTG